jgi:hypothetical protein
MNRRNFLKGITVFSISPISIIEAKSVKPLSIESTVERNVEYKTNGVERMRIDSSGNLHIG